MASLRKEMFSGWLSDSCGALNCRKCSSLTNAVSPSRPRGAAVSSVTAGWTPAVWCVVAGPPPERTLSTSSPPWSACQDWILASTPSSPSLTVSLCGRFLFNIQRGRQTGRGRSERKCSERSSWFTQKSVTGVIFLWRRVLLSMHLSFLSFRMESCRNFGPHAATFLLIFS